MIIKLSQDLDVEFMPHGGIMLTSIVQEADTLVEEFELTSQEAAALYNALNAAFSK
jgi:hypothetical protein